jgi:glycosyltransferase involved in cell wall biosynthesis
MRRRDELATPRLRILMLMAALPYPPIWGTGLRNYHLLRFLAQRHDVTLLTYATSWDPGAAKALSDLGVRTILEAQPGGFEGPAKRRRQLRSLMSRRSYHSAAIFSRSFQVTLDRQMADRPYDIIQVEQSTMSLFELSASPAPVVLDEHNIEYEILRRSVGVESSPLRKLYYMSEYLKHRREEIASWRAASGCTLTSPREERLLQQIVPGKPTAVVANSVDVAHFHPSDRAVDPNELVFTGLMSYRPNVDAMVHFVGTVLPRIRRVRPRVHLTIVGAGPAPEVTRLAGPNVRVTGAVADVRPYLERAAAVVVPIRSGSGTRFKVAEGLAMRKAVVSTSLGAEGIDVRHGEHLLIADDAAQFAEQVVRVLEDTQLASSLGERGRELAEQKLSWESAGARLESFYAELRQRAAGTGQHIDTRVVYRGAAGV